MRLEKASKIVSELKRVFQETNELKDELTRLQAASLLADVEICREATISSIIASYNRIAERAKEA